MLKNKKWVDRDRSERSNQPSPTAKTFQLARSNRESRDGMELASPDTYSRSAHALQRRCRGWIAHRNQLHLCHLERKVISGKEDDPYVLMLLCPWVGPNRCRQRRQQ